ncbi:MAG: metallophosphoesterase [Pseudomonadota bacterium]
MKRIAWATDVHLDFLNDGEIDAFCRQISRENADAFLLAGDISDAPSLGEHLRFLENSLACKVYFVLGNHDYYHGSISGVRQEIGVITRDSDRLHWLPVAGIVELDRKTCLVGHDGWADGGYGDFDNSTVMLNDYKLIGELAGLEKQARRALIGQLGREAAEYLQSVLGAALDQYNEVIVLTHVPPFREACCHEGQIADDNWLPHFSCKAVGDVLFQAMQSRPTRHMTVLCGHTHHRAEVFPLRNLRVKTGAAEYGKPQLQEVFYV